MPLHIRSRTRYKRRVHCLQYHICKFKDFFVAVSYTHLQFRHHPFRWCGTRVYHVAERICTITSEWLVVLYFLYLASDGGTDFHDLFT